MSEESKVKIELIYGDYRLLIFPLRWYFKKEKHKIFTDMHVNFLCFRFIYPNKED